MARDFSGTTQYYEYNGAQITAAPITISAWFNSHSYDATYGNIIFGVWDASGFGDGLALVRQTDGNLIAVTLAGGAQSSSALAISSNTIYHGCAVIASATSRLIYLDGSPGTENTTSRTPSGIDVSAIGVGAWVGIHDGEFDGIIGEVGIWNVALTAGEVTALAKGYSPLFIRPQNLVHYIPMIRNVIDRVGGYNFAATGSPIVAPHNFGVLCPANLIGHSFAEVGTTINSTLGEITIDGKNPNISEGINIACALGAVSIAGLNSEVFQGIDINCTLGEINVVGLNSDISEGINVNSTLGQIDIAGLNSNVSIGIDVDSTLGEASISGLNVDINLGTVINCTAGNINIAKLNADISVGIDINCASGSINITGLNPNINLGVIVEVTLGEVSIVGQNTTIEAGTTIDCSLGEIAVSGLNPDISLPTNIDCTKGDISVSSLNADVVSTILIGVTLGQIDISGLIVNIQIGELKSSPFDRTFIIAAENRTLAIEVENRTLIIESENRTLII